MNSKQLANVLIKILGLSICIHSIPSLASWVFFLMVTTRHVVPMMNEGWVYPLSSVLMAAIGVYLVVQSRAVTGMLFDTDDESLKDA